MTDAEKGALREGDVVWFTKSMRRVRILQESGPGYIVARVDTGQRLYATRDGLSVTNPAEED